MTVSTIFVALLSHVERLTQCIMPQKTTIRRYNTATGCWDVLEPDKQADQQVTRKATTALIRYCQSQSYCHSETEVKT